MPPAMWERGRRTTLSPRILALISVGFLLTFLFAAPTASAATTVQVKVGGVYAGEPLAKGGGVWFNGYDPAPLVIHVGDTAQRKLIGGVHTVTSPQPPHPTPLTYHSNPL